LRDPAVRTCAEAAVAFLAVRPPADPRVVEILDVHLVDLELLDLVGIDQIPQPAVVIGVAVRGYERIQLDRIALIVALEFPIDEISCIPVRRLLGADPPAVDEDVPVVRRADQNTVTLTDVDEVELEQRLAAEVLRFHQPVLTSGAHACVLIAVAGLLLLDVDEISPQQLGHQSMLPLCVALDETGGVTLDAVCLRLCHRESPAIGVTRWSRFPTVSLEE
jgi:hypothetical protein